MISDQILFNVYEFERGNDWLQKESISIERCEIKNKKADEIVRTLLVTTKEWFSELVIVGDNFLLGHNDVFDDEIKITELDLYLMRMGDPIPHIVEELLVQIYHF